MLLTLKFREIYLGGVLMGRDRGEFGLVMLMLFAFMLYAVAGGTAPSEKAEPTSQETQQEERVNSDITSEEIPETPMVQETVVPTAENSIEPELGELSPEEIQQQETDYMLGYAYGALVYNHYEMIKSEYEFNLSGISEHTYQEVCEAIEELLQEAMQNSEISDSAIEKYNTAVSHIPDKESWQLKQENIGNIQGFQDGVILYSYVSAVNELYYSKVITDEQYQAYKVQMDSYYVKNENGEIIDTTQTTVPQQIDCSKKILAQYGKENIPIPYFN